MTIRAILSGGIGSGKSTAAEIFRALGAEVISADEAGHRVLEPGGEAYDAVVERWPSVVGASGRIDRRALGTIVFDDLEQLRELEGITHPAIRQRILQAVHTSEAVAVFVELPLDRDLLGGGWRRVVIDSPRDLRRARLLARGMAAEEIEQRMSAQPERSAWLARADQVITNDGDLDHLGRECLRVWKSLTGLDGPA